MTAFADHIHLVPWEECVGPLRELRSEPGGLIAVIGKIQLMLPCELRTSLDGLVGCRIGVLRTDKNYRIRAFH